MHKTLKTITLINLFALISYFGYTVYQKESLLRQGDLILLELVPVDPRSLMQGDYMDLQYTFSMLNDVRISHPDSFPKRGFCVVRSDSNGVAQFRRFQDSKAPLEPEEKIIAYTRPDYRILIGAESFFFEEGTGKYFEEAKYGGLKVDQNGNSLLIGLFDEEKNQILPNDPKN